MTKKEKKAVKSKSSGQTLEPIHLEIYQHLQVFPQLSPTEKAAMGLQLQELIKPIEQIVQSGLERPNPPDPKENSNRTKNQDRPQTRNRYTIEQKLLFLYYYQTQPTLGQAATKAGVRPSTASAWLRTLRLRPDRNILTRPPSQARKTSILKDVHRQWVIEQFDRDPDMTVAGLRDSLEGRFDDSLKHTSLLRFVQKECFMAFQRISWPDQRLVESLAGYRLNGVFLDEAVVDVMVRPGSTWRSNYRLGMREGVCDGSLTLFGAVSSQGWMKVGSVESGIASRRRQTSPERQVGAFHYIKFVLDVLSILDTIPSMNRSYIVMSHVPQESVHYIDGIVSERGYQSIFKSFVMDRFWDLFLNKVNRSKLVGSETLNSRLETVQLTETQVRSCLKETIKKSLNK